MIFKDGVTHQTSYVIEADLNTVWNTFNNTSEMPQWMYGLAEVRTIKGRYGEEGAIVDFIYKNEAGTESSVRERITKVVPSKRFEFVGENDDFLMTGIVVFEATTDGTKVTQDLTYKGKTWYWTAMAPLMESVFKTSSEGLYANLKRYLESNESREAWQIKSP